MTTLSDVAHSKIAPQPSSPEPVEKSSEVARINGTTQCAAPRFNRIFEHLFYDYSQPSHVNANTRTDKYSNRSPLD